MEDNGPMGAAAILVAEPHNLKERKEPCIECPYRVNTITDFRGVQGRRRLCSIMQDKTHVQTCHMTELTHACRGAQIFQGKAPANPVITGGVDSNIHFVRIEEFFE